MNDPMSPDRPLADRHQQSYSAAPLDDERDVCRVCRSGAPEDGELFWPCQCSGSMRFVHEACLKDWIKARGTEDAPKCELCHTPLSFTQVYAADMPPALPLHQLVVHAIRSSLRIILLGLRAILVAFSWLAVLPFAIVWVFRFLLFTADSIGIVTLAVTGRVPRRAGPVFSSRVASAISQVHAAVNSKSLGELQSGLLSNLTALSASWTNVERTELLDQAKEALWNAEQALRCEQTTQLAQTLNPIGNLSALAYMTRQQLLDRASTKPWTNLLESVLNDTFRGQIITSAVVSVFVVCFLLREWIAMNTPLAEANVERQAEAAAVAQREAEEIARVIQLLRQTPNRQDAGGDALRDQAFDSNASRGHRSEHGFSAEHDSDPSRAEGEWSDLSDEEVESSLVAASLRRRPVYEAVGRHHQGGEGYEVPVMERERRHDDSLGAADIGSERRLELRANIGQSIPTSDAAVAPTAPPLELPRAPPPFALNLEEARDVANDNNDAEVDFGDEGLPDEVFDDVDSILDAIGMKGSLLTLVQHLSLMIMLISLCLAGGVWLPLCIGRVLAAGNVIKLVSAPIRLVRSISDPLFDFIFGALASLPRHLLAFVRRQEIVQGLSSSAARLRPATASIGTRLVASGPSLDSASNSERIKPIAVSFLKRALSTTRSHWNQMAINDDPLHRVLCVALGYSSALLGGVWYLKSTQSEYSQQMNKAVRDGIKQQLTLLKVSIFVFVEIVVFPAACGAILDLVSMPLFPGTTLASRIAYHRRAPISSLFVTWLSGTAFMFAFSSWIDLMRSKARKGLIWFIRDPQAADFHPIREILERSSRSQARKIATSALLYTTVIVLSIGVNVQALKYAGYGILPLRWNERSSAALPVDLLLYRFVVPFTIQLVDPRQRTVKLCVEWSKRTAHSLRLTSFIFGVRDPTEEISHVRSTWRAKLTLKKAHEGGDVGAAPNDAVTGRDVYAKRDGGFVRVPASDAVHIAPGRKMLVPVTEEGHPVDEEGSRIIAAQLVEMASTRKNDKYQVVYVPPNFRLRLGLFIYLSWFVGSFSASSFILAPLLVGRWLFSTVVDSHVHDAYSFGLGAYVIGAVVWAIHRRADLVKAITSPSTIAGVLPLSVAIALGGVVVPTLMSGVALVYLYIPLTLTRPTPIALDGQPIVVHIGFCWAFGILLLTIAYHLFNKLLPRDDPFRLATEVFSLVLARNEVVSAAQIANGYFIPLAIRLATLVVLPFTVAVGRSALLSGSLSPSTRDVQVCAAFTAMVVTAALLRDKVQHWAHNWAQRKLEESYIVERRLRNFEKGVEQQLEEATAIM